MFIRDSYAKDASAQWRKLEAGRKAKAAAQKKIEKQIKAAEKLESQLEKEERERLAELEAAAARKAQTAWLDSGILEDLRTKASEQGRKAVAYATDQLGTVRVGRRGPEDVRLLGADLPGVG